MPKRIFILLLLLFFPANLYAAEPGANKIKTNTTAFNNNLGAGDTTVQAALDTIDNLSTGGGAVNDTAYGSSWNGVTTIAPSKNAVYDKIETLGGGVTSVSGTAPISSSGGTTPAISIPKANSTTDGYLNATDWTTFNNKQAPGSYALNATFINTTSPLSGGGNLSADRTLSIPKGTSSADGYINSTDWSTFNNKGNISGVGVADQISYFTGANTIAGNGNMTFNATTNLTTLYNLTLTTPLADGSVANDITLTNITQVTARSHTLLTDIGTNTHATIDTHLAAANPHSDSLNKTLTSAYVFVGNATNISTGVAMSGDVAIDNAGATTIQVNSVALGTDTTNNYVASIATTAPITGGAAGSEGAALTIAIPKGNSTVDGYINATDWTTFNNKGSGNTNITSLEFTILPESMVLDDNNPPAITVVESTGTGTMRYRVAQFDGATNESVYQSFVMPSYYNSSGTLSADVYWYINNATAANVTWGIWLSATTPGDADTPKEQAVGTINTNFGSVDTTEANRLLKTTINITNLDSLAANDDVGIKFQRVPTDGNDTSATDAEVKSIKLKIPL